MSNRKSLKFNNSVVKKFNNANINSFMGTPVASGYSAETPSTGYSITVDPSGETKTSGYLLSFCYIKFDTFPVSDSDYDLSTSSSTTTIFSNKTTAYIWGYGYQLNGGSFVELDSSTYDSATQVQFSTDSTIKLYKHTHEDVCLAENTEILLADGTTKLIQNITYDDLLLTYDPYLRDWIAEYPALITGPRPHHHKYKIKFANGKYIETTDDHAVYNMRTDTFQTIPEVSTENFYGAYYDKTIGDFVSTQIVDIESIDCEVNAYNVFTPMCGSIIANGMWVSGNYLSFEPIELVLKGQTSRDWNVALLDSNINNEKEEDFINSFIDFNSRVNQLGANMPIQLYMASVRKYIPMMIRLFPQLSDFLSNTDFLAQQIVEILNGCLENINPYPTTCKIRLDNEVIATVYTENTFIFPNTYNEYLDLTDYKTYKAGDIKTIYINTVIVGKGEKNDGR